MGKFWRISSLALALVLSAPIVGFGHSGRTDSSGGHKDNKNASGLGSYHYHHGYGPHLHENGVCPYDDEAAGEPVSKKTRNGSSSYVTSQKTYLYTDADVESDKLLAVPKGTKCEALESTKYFIKTILDGETGYVRKKHIKAD